MPTYYSQYGEDFILDRVFADQDTGFFVEVGCIDGLRFSNTLTFAERGWNGMCVEAHTDYINALKENRQESIVCHCAAGEEDAEDVPFYANDRGSLSTLDGSREEEFQANYGTYFSGFEQQSVPKRRLDSLFEQYDVPSQIDFLSLDIEGYEVEALAGMELTKYRPRVLIIESDSSDHERRLDDRLLTEGYEKTFRVQQNIFYFDDDRLARRVQDDHYTVTLTHTCHPLDEGGEEEKKVTVSLKRYNLSSRVRQFVRKVYWKIRIECNSFLDSLQNLFKWSRLYFKGEPHLENGSFLISDGDVIDRFKRNERNPYLVSFPRTGSHWLRMLIELYFERPLLTRTFFYPSRDDYLLLHTHDTELDVERSNVLYLYRSPVETIYSLMSYHGESMDDGERVRHWARRYGFHLDKWLHQESFTEKKTIIRYEGMKKDLVNEFEKICDHFDEPLDENRFKDVKHRVTKDLVKQKTKHNDRILNMNHDAYVERRKRFRSQYEDLIWSVLLTDREHLRSGFSVDATSVDTA